MGNSNFRIEHVYKTRKGVVRIYGGKVVENVCQALARCAIGEQMLRVAKRYKVVLTVHDAVACLGKKDNIREGLLHVDACMKFTPEWAKGLPLTCELGYGISYADAGNKKKIELYELDKLNV